MRTFLIQHLSSAAPRSSLFWDWIPHTHSSLSVSKIFDWLSVHLWIMSKMQNSRRQQNYSDESNLSSNSQSSIRSAATGTTQEVTSPLDSILYTKANNCLSLSIPIDHPGQHRLQPIYRRTRLVKSIQLNPHQLWDIFLYIFKNRDISSVHWEEDFVFQYVPEIFETATVSKPIAVFALEEAILYNCYCFHLIPEWVSPFPSFPLLVIYLTSFI